MTRKPSGKKFESYKETTREIYKDKKGSIQRLIPVNRIARDGIFEIEAADEGRERLFDKAYILKDTNYVTKDEDEQELFLKGWCRILNSMNTSAKIVIMNNRRDMEQFELGTFIRHREGEPGTHGELVENVNHIIREKAVDGAGRIEQVKVLILSCRRQDFTAARAYFHTIEATLVSNIRNLESGLVPLDAEGRLRLLHSFYRLGDEGSFRFNFDDAVRFPGKEWLNAVANRKIVVREDFMEFEDRYVAALYVWDWPKSSIDDKFISELASLPFHMVVTVDIGPIPKDVAQKKLLDVYMSVGDSIERTREQRRRNGQFDSDIPFERRKEMERTEDALEIARENDENMFYCGIYVLVTAPTQAQLDSSILNIQAVAKSYAFKIDAHYLHQVEAMNTALPTAAREVSTMRPLWTQPLSALVPFKIQELMDPGGTFYGTNQASKNPQFVNRKMLQNGNGWIFGTPGSGKSMEAKFCEIIQPILNSDDDVIIIDPMNEYRSLVEALGGQYIPISTDTDNFINPLDAENLKGYETREEFIADKAELMLGICEQAMQQEITSGMKSIIVRCVQIFYRQMLAEKKAEEWTMRELYEIFGQQPEPEARILRLGLELFVTGSLNIFSHKGNVNMKNRLICFGISGLGEDLAPVGMLVVLEAIRSRIMGNFYRSRATRLIVDEFHRMTDRTYTAKRMNKIWKEVRKLGGLCTGITQNIVDVTAMPEIVTMISNSEFFIFLKQGDKDADVISRLLGLSDNLLEKVIGADKGCGILKVGTKVVPFDNKIPKDLFIYRLLNTDFHELSAAEKRGGAVKKRIAQMKEETRWMESLSGEPTPWDDHADARLDLKKL